MPRLLLLTSAAYRFQVMVRRIIKDLGGQVTAEELQKSVFSRIYTKYRRPNRLKALIIKLDAMVDEGVLECPVDENGYQILDVYAVKRRRNVEQCQRE